MIFETLEVCRLLTSYTPFKILACDWLQPFACRVRAAFLADATRAALGRAATARRP